MWEDVRVRDGPVDRATGPGARGAAGLLAQRPRERQGEAGSGHAARAARRRAGALRVRGLARGSATGLANVYLAVSRNHGKHFHKPVRVSDNARRRGRRDVPDRGGARRRGVRRLAGAGGRAQRRARPRDARPLRREGPQARRRRARGRRRRGRQVARPGDLRRLDARCWPGSTSATAARRACRSSTSTRPAAPTAAASRANVRVDAGAPVPLAAHLDNKWSPTIAAAGGKVLRRLGGLPPLQLGHLLRALRRWRAHVRRRTCRSTTSPGSSGSTSGRRWRSTRSAACTRPGPTCARASRTRTSSTRAATTAGRRFSPNRQLDDSRPGFDPDRDTPTNQWHPSLAVGGRHAVRGVAGQPARQQRRVLHAAARTAARPSPPSERVDDTGAGHSEQSRPHMAWADGRCHVVWEDNRSGNPDVFTARRPCLFPAKSKKSKR